MLMDDRFHRKILDFVLARSHESGGFGASPTLPPSVEDTYLAIRILEFLCPVLEDEVASVIRDPSLAHYLLDPEDREEWNAKTGFQYVYSCRVVGLAPNREWISKFVADRLGDSPGLAERFYCTSMIKGCPDHASEKLALPVNDDFSINWRTAKELWMALDMVGGHPEKFHTDRKDLLAWVRSCQNPDGGFGFLPGTTSYMENGHACLRTLALLKASPSNPAGAVRFIMNAWTTSGGFARKRGGAPFLDATWHAVASLSLLHDQD